MGSVERRPRVMIVAGEASGDMHGAKLTEALRAGNESLTIFGVGGERMRAAGVQVVVDAHRLAVVGITEVFAKLPRILEGMRTAKRLVGEKRPDLLILIDYPDFNLHLAAFAKKRAVPVLYYISPQIWAWRQGRVRKIKRIVDHMAVILPFEEAFYRRHGVPATFVGHPLMDHYSALPERRPRDAGGIVTIGLMPGSRDGEVAKLLPLMLTAAALIGRQRRVRFMLSQAPSVSPALIQGLTVSVDADVTVCKGAAGPLLRSADLVITKSGTSTLEAAIHGTPMVIVYKVSPLSYRLGKALIQVPHIGLVNLIAGRRVAPELVQHEASPEAVADEILALLDHPDRMVAMRKALADVTRRLGDPGASIKVAAVARRLLHRETAQPTGALDAAKEEHEG